MYPITVTTELLPIVVASLSALRGNVNCVEGRCEAESCEMAHGTWHMAHLVSKLVDNSVSKPKHRKGEIFHKTPCFVFVHY
eukprot:scaffold3785_cov101-Skeletonema_dohrnii-CCMP3373.AAC.6